MKNIPLYFPPSQFSPRFGTQFFTIEITQCRIVYDKEKKQKFAVYQFTIKRGRQTKTVFYRYSEIRQFHEYLCSTSLGQVANYVPFPAKTWTIYPKLDETFLDDRRQQIEQYFQKLLSSSRVMSQIPCVRRFLCIDSFIVKPWYLE
mmetsp:Transcript_59226/g.97856  ORF Transcript_59226/g.97856 Transcript_59226/m.97856 type:complete len:146 (-) Transcript_59226:1129-1566(-)